MPLNLVPSMSQLNDFYLPIDVELHPDDLTEEDTPINFADMVIEDVNPTQSSDFTEKESSQRIPYPNKGHEITIIISQGDQESSCVSSDRKDRYIKPVLKRRSIFSNKGSVMSNKSSKSPKKRTENSRGYVNSPKNNPVNMSFFKRGTESSEKSYSHGGSPMNRLNINNNSGFLGFGYNDSIIINNLTPRGAEDSPKELERTITLPISNLLNLNTPNFTNRIQVEDNNQ